MAPRQKDPEKESFPPRVGAPSKEGCAFRARNRVIPFSLSLTWT